MAQWWRAYFSYRGSRVLLLALLMSSGSQPPQIQALRSDTLSCPLMAYTCGIHSHADIEYTYTHDKKNKPGLVRKLRLASNTWPSPCLCLPNRRTTGLKHHTQGQLFCSVVFLFQNKNL